MEKVEHDIIPVCILVEWLRGDVKLRVRFTGTASPSTR
jgi:hypothetical protein